MSNECWRRIVTTPCGCPHRSAGNGFCGGYGYEQTHFKFFTQQWTNNGPDGGPYSQILRGSPAKWLEKVKKSCRSTPSWLSSEENRLSLLLPSVVLKYPWLANIYLGMSSPNSCGMLGNLAKLATLWVTLHSDAPIQGNTVLSWIVMEIFYGKVNTDPTERKSLRSMKRNHWPTVSNKRFGKWFSYISATPFKLFTWLLPQLQGGASRCSFCRMERSYSLSCNFVWCFGSQYWVVCQRQSTQASWPLL